LKTKKSNKTEILKSKPENTTKNLENLFGNRKAQKSFAITDS
jgi:hypothetical protein